MEERNMEKKKEKLKIDKATSVAYKQDNITKAQKMLDFVFSNRFALSCVKKTSSHMYGGEDVSKILSRKVIASRIPRFALHPFWGNCIP